MKRREVLILGLGALAATRRRSAPIPAIPLRVILDSERIRRDDDVKRMTRQIEIAKRDFGHSGITLSITAAEGAIALKNGTVDKYIGLDRSSLNIFFTRVVPPALTSSAAKSGGMRGTAFCTRQNGTHVAIISLENATEGAIPLFATPTLTHEILHHLTGDTHRNWSWAGEAEWRDLQIESLASAMHAGASIELVRRDTESFVAHLYA